MGFPDQATRWTGALAPSGQPLVFYCLPLHVPRSPAYGPVASGHTPALPQKHVDYEYTLFHERALLGTTVPLTFTVRVREPGHTGAPDAARRAESPEEYM